MATGAPSALKSVGRKPHFIATFVPNSSSDRLEIPHKFHQHIGVRTNVWVLLSGRGGKVWRVGLLKLHDTLIFNEGWAGFVKDSFVEIGDILVFEYSGDWLFEVYIFGENGCEKEVRDCLGKLGPSLQKKRVRDGDTSSGRVVKKTGSDACISNVDCMNHEQEDFVATPCQLGAPVTEPLALIIYREPWIEAEAQEIKYKQTSQRLNSDPKWSKSSLYIFNHTLVLFITKMQKYNVDFRRVLNIPMQFIRENSLSYLTDEKMVLRTETGSSWSVNIVANTVDINYAEGGLLL
uniref:TF-B3 domain-containing protein n=1 Tax=Kalanchoe fedtschenkoi TaxID=63787 RepID=A0A7N0TBC0_KALFE